MRGTITISRSAWSPGSRATRCGSAPTPMWRWGSRKRRGELTVKGDSPSPFPRPLWEREGAAKRRKGEGESGSPEAAPHRFGQMPRNIVQHAVDVHHYVIVPETDHAIAFAIEEARARLVAITPLGVRGIVGF